jgi:glycosyltransferase involved in cell wall biosynthesis
MIVRDEEKMLRRCLEKSVCEAADELIVVDTGSRDGTVNIAREFGAKLYHFTWCDDCSSARNESLQYASGDWILQIDGDEALLPHLQYARPYHETLRDSERLLRKAEPRWTIEHRP